MDSGDADINETRTFRIRFTISNKSNSGEDRQCNRRENDSSHQTPSFCCRTSQCKQTVADETNGPPNRPLDASCSTSHTRKKLFKFLQPQNHKSSLFVNLSDIGSSEISAIGANTSRQPIISPDLDHQLCSLSPPTPIEAFVADLPNPFNESVEVSTKNDDHSSAFLFDCDEINPDLELKDSKPDSESEAKMSQGCNFINTLMSASRHRSSSVTPGGPTSSLKLIDGNQGRRASSSTDLTPPSLEPRLESKSPSGNHLSVSTPNETIKPLYYRNESDGSAEEASDYVDLSQMRTMQPLQINIEPPNELDAGNRDTSYISMETVCNNHPISLDEILQIDMDDLRLEDQCKDLEQQVKFWEDKVDDLERKRFSDDVPRTLVDNVLKQRRKLREIELQILMMSQDSGQTLNNAEIPVSKASINMQYNLDYDPHNYQRNQKMSEDYVSPKHFGGSVADDDTHSEDDEGFYTRLDEKGGGFGGGFVDIGAVNTMQATGKFGSYIKPGQENTADILDAIPPSGSLQHKQYLNKASSGTDSGDYSQLPTFDPHKFSHKHIISLSGSRQPQQQQRHHHHHHHHHHRGQQQLKLDNDEQ